MRIVVIGGGGQVGSKTIELAKNREEVYATYQTRKPPLEESRIFRIDKTNRGSILDLFSKLRPEVAIDTGALHNVDQCETNRSEAWAVNVQGTKNVAEACLKNHARMIFVSTDYVFDGTKGNYTEDDEPNPISYYGVTKLEAERTVAQVLKDYVIARPSIIYSYVSISQRQSSSGKPLNFAMWLVQKLSNNEQLKIVTDQYSSPTLADSLAETLLRLARSDVTGIYHTAGGTRLSRFEFSKKIARKFDLREDLMTPIVTDQLKQTAKRPMDSSLNVTKIERDLEIRMPMIDEALDRFTSQYRIEKSKLDTK